MQFVDIDADFGQGMVMFVVSFQELDSEPYIKDLVKRMHTGLDPKDIALIWERTIQALHPELTGCQVVAFSTNIGLQQFEIVVLHSSLDRVNCGQSAPVRRLSVHILPTPKEN